MPVNPDLKRYDLFGWDYAPIQPLTDEEVAWHLKRARRTGSPLLGLACGTGRLLCRLAREGFQIVGLDLSDTMLRLARRHVAKLPAKARSRIRLVQANMTDFDLGRQFGLIFIADNSFREQETRRDLLRCLRCIRRHLRPGGKLLITERRLKLSLYHKHVRGFGWSQPLPHPDTGELVSRRGEIRLSKDRRRARGKFIYKTVHADGSETVEECPWSAPVLRKGEYIDLFARAGFATRTFIDYSEVEDDGKSKLLCFVCEVGQ